MCALKGLWIFTVAVSLFVGIALVVCLVISLMAGNQVQHPAKVSIVRDRVPVDCFRLIKGDPSEQRRASQYTKFHERKVLSDEDYTNMTSDCAKFIEQRGYVTSALTDEEENFPIAFDILVSKDIELFERLLRAVYRPQNVYCVHVDKTAESTLYDAVGNITGCFDNVFVLPNDTVEINQGVHLVTVPDIRCMEALLKYSNWIYFISLTGQEFPLRTNWELVKILKTLRGASIIDANIGLPPPALLVGNMLPRIDVSELKAPVHIVAKRHLVQFAVNDDKARQALDWTPPVRLPSRFHFAPLKSETQKQAQNSGPTIMERQYIDRYRLWQTGDLPCRGNSSEDFCTYGISDLPMLAASPHFFARKFELDFEPLGLDCLEELVFNRTVEEMLGLTEFNTCYYECLLR